MNIFENKLVAILNKSVEVGKVMNALAHMCIGFGAHLGADRLELMDYEDADGNRHPNISKIPFIILRANASKLKKCRSEAISQGISCGDFTNTMVVGTWQEQFEETKQTGEADLEYYGIVLCGDWEKVSEITKKFSLWR